MDSKINLHSFHPPPRIHPTANPPTIKKSERVGNESKVSFEQLLKQELVQFSHHASMRLKQRGIQLKAEHIHKIDQAMTQAEQKGAKDALFLLKDIALIVNIPNRTVITAMQQGQDEMSVITKIDSAVIL